MWLGQAKWFRWQGATEGPSQCGVGCQANKVAAPGISWVRHVARPVPATPTLALPVCPLAQPLHTSLQSVPRAPTPELGCKKPGRVHGPSCSRMCLSGDPREPTSPRQDSWEQAGRQWLGLECRPPSPGQGSSPHTILSGPGRWGLDSPQSQVLPCLACPASYHQARG